MVWYSQVGFENRNAVRMSAAGDGWTEPNQYFRTAKMRTNPIWSTKKNTIEKMVFFFMQFHLKA